MKLWFAPVPSRFARPIPASRSPAMNAQPVGPVDVAGIDAAYDETVEMGGEVAQAMRAFRTLIGTSDMLAYLSMMAPRLVELRRVLTQTGSLYLHCDPADQARILLKKSTRAKREPGTVIPQGNPKSNWATE